MTSYATNRKIRIIEEKVGPNWRAMNPGRSIDAIYNDLVGDQRRTLFCKISERTKLELAELVTYHEEKMAEFIERLIHTEYESYRVKMEKAARALASDFSGN